MKNPFKRLFNYFACDVPSKPDPVSESGCFQKGMRPTDHKNPMEAVLSAAIEAAEQIHTSSHTEYQLMTMHLDHALEYRSKSNRLMEDQELAGLMKVITEYRQTPKR